MKHNLMEFDVEVNDIITPLSCSTMIIEFIKYIIYQKQLIPYQYDRLKMYVDRRKNQLDSTTNAENSFCINLNSQQLLVSDKYFKKLHDAYNSLESIFNVICDSCDRIEEVVLLLGTSFLNPHDVFRICIPSLDYTHSDAHHSTRKNSRSLFKSIINSEQLYNLISASNCTSNLHVMIKTKPDVAFDSKLMVQRNGFKLPSKGNQVCITFKPTLSNPSCSCLKLQIFEDESSTTAQFSNSSDCTSSSDCSENVSSLASNWYQMKDTLRYFTDASINGVSVPDIWMNPNLLQRK